MISEQLKLNSMVFLILFSISSFGQIELKTLSPKDMRKDLKNLLETVDAHPDPYTKISKSDFDTLIKEVEQDISTELDEIDFYKNMSQIVAAIGDGHSSLYLPDSWLKNARKKYGVFPYEVVLSNEGELFVIKSFGDSQITPGAQILEINGMAVPDFVKTVNPFISYETIPFRNDRISSSFEQMLYLVFKNADQLNFKYKVVKELEATVSNMNYKEWKKQKKDLREDREKKVALGKPYDFKILKKGIAKLDIFSFSVVDLDKFAFFLNKTFKEIKNEEVHSLIIDVRGNYGGWPKIASEVFHYISESPFKTMAQSSMKISSAYRKSYIDLNPAINRAGVRFEQRRHFVDLKEVIKGELNTYINEEAFFNEAPITKNHEFSGDCYLLIDRKSYSASSCFASTFQCYSMGYLIGEPTGGTKIFRANPFTRKLSKSKFTVRMSTTKLFSACYLGENEAVIPNVEVVPTILDLVHDGDPQLITALNLIKKMQREKE